MKIIIKNIKGETFQIETHQSETVHLKSEIYLSFLFVN